MLLLHDKMVVWPFEDEKKSLSNCSFITYELPNCVGIIDGILVFLTEAPEWSGEDFNTKKDGYGVNALVVCDDHGQLTYYYIGLPGSTWDNNSYRNCKLSFKEE